MHRGTVGPRIPPSVFQDGGLSHAITPHLQSTNDGYGSAEFVEYDDWRVAFGIEVQEGPVLEDDVSSSAAITGELLLVDIEGGKTLRKASNFIISKAACARDVVAEAFHETKEKPLRRMGALALAGTTQYFDRVREPFVQLSNVATEHLAEGSLNFTDGIVNSSEAGLMAGGILAGSYFAIGQGINIGVRSLPKTTKKIEEQFPRLYKVAKYSTAGIIGDSSSEMDEQGQNVVVGAAKAAKKKIGGAFDYAAQGIGLGTAAQAAVSAMEGWSFKESTKLIAKTSAAMGAAVVPIVVGLDAGVDALVRHEQYDWAERVTDVVTSRWTWLTLAGANIAANYRKNTRIAQGGA